MKKFKFYFCRGIACVDKMELIKFIDYFNLLEPLHHISIAEIIEKEVELPEGDYTIRFSKGSHDYAEIHNTPEEFYKHFDKNINDAVLFNSERIQIIYHQDEELPGKEIAHFSSKFLFGKDNQLETTFFEQSAFENLE